jgi:plasmid maintenance system antidote protein VapI
MPISYKTSMLRWRKRRERAIRLAKQGHSKSAIARVLGVSRQRVHQIVNGNAT